MTEFPPNSIILPLQQSPFTSSLLILFSYLRRGLMENTESDEAYSSEPIVSVTQLPSKQVTSYLGVPVPS